MWISFFNQRDPNAEGNSVAWLLFFLSSSPTDTEL